MKLFAKLIMATAVVAGYGVANAGFVIEPFIGYEMGEVKQGSDKADISGTEFGLRVGGTMALFSYGLEYAIGGLENEKTAAFEKSDIDTKDIGLFVGFDFPILLRAYATYFIKSEADVKKANLDLEGSGFRIGVGYTGLPFISINLEHISRTYDEYQGGSLAEDFEVTTNMLSVSIPLP